MTQRFFRRGRPPKGFSIWCLLITVLFGSRSHAQDYWPDSLKNALAHATEWRDKAHMATNLALFYFGQNRPLSDEYGRQAVEAAEMSRDRMLMIQTYIDNGRRFEQGVGLKGNLEMAMDFFRRAEKIAKDEKLDKGLVYTDVAFAEAFRTLGDNEEAMTYSNQAVTTASDLDDDSVQVAAYTSLGEAYQARNEQLLAFRNYLKALEVAERGKDDWLTRNASAYVAYFYYGIHEEDKAIDYEVNSIIPIDRKLKHFYELRADYNTLAQFFTRKGEYDIATESYEHAIQLADSIHFNLVKIDSYFGIFNNYFKSGQYQKGMDYFEQHPVVSDYLRHAGMQYVIDGIYADAYTDMGRFDSAAYYFDREGPQVEAKANAPAKADFYDEIGDFYKKRQMWEKAIGYYQKEEAIGKAMGDLHTLEHADESLDTLYLRTNDFAKAYAYHTQHVQYSDSLRELGKATELLKLEVDNDTRRRDRLAREETQAREHRHNVQYMGFTVGLVALFIALVMMGWLAVPTSVIRGLGFLSFIFLFEFIILLTDKQISELTHDEPWKVLLIKIALAAILLPLHHWSEHRVIHFLSSRKRFKGGHRVVGAPEATGAAPAGEAATSN
jgi:tetratricopeptide (TPR) repeat protein